LFAIGAVSSSGATSTARLAGSSGRCRVAAAPIQIELIAADRARGATGAAELRFASSVFGPAVTNDGRYVYDVKVATLGLRPQPAGVYVAWIATADLSAAINLGPLGNEMAAMGSVEWNQFHVFVTLEAEAGGDTWSGPIFLSGISPSSRMHTMAGHGIFEQHTALC